LLKAVIFDLDDTLMPDEAAADAAIIAVAEQTSAVHNIAPEDLRASVRRISRALFRANPIVRDYDSFEVSSWEALTAGFCGDDAEMTALREWVPSFRYEVWLQALAENGVADPALADRLASLYREERRARYAPYPDVLPVLAVLKPRYRLGVITNGPSDLQRTKLARSGLDVWFPVQVISREVGVAKPDPRIFAIALERLGVAAAEAVFVGDSPKHDIDGARAGGMKAVWLRRDGAAGIRPAAQGGGVESEDVRADAVIHTLDELVPLLESL
jgi:putative hydrolase of the HAD superfamily